MTVCIFDTDDSSSSDSSSDSDSDSSSSSGSDSSGSDSESSSSSSEDEAPAQKRKGKAPLPPPPARPPSNGAHRRYCHIILCTPQECCLNVTACSVSEPSRQCFIACKIGCLYIQSAPRHAFLCAGTHTLQIRQCNEQFIQLSSIHAVCPGQVVTGKTKSKNLSAILAIVP